MARLSGAGFVVHGASMLQSSPGHSAPAFTASKMAPCTTRAMLVAFRASFCPVIRCHASVNTRPAASPPRTLRTRFSGLYSVLLIPREYPRGEVGNLRPAPALVRERGACLRAHQHEPAVDDEGRAGDVPGG